jgi:hypothetical protein
MIGERGRERYSRGEREGRAEIEGRAGLLEITVSIFLITTSKEWLLLRPVPLRTSTK